MKNHWKLESVKKVLQTVPFAVELLKYFDPTTGDPVKSTYHRLCCPDWISVFAVTKNNEFILVEQKRAGVQDFTLEAPGGVIDSGEDPKTAALRELEEETGYKCKEIVSLGSTYPNPALMNNKLHMFIALDCFIPEVRKHFPDENESINLHIKPMSQLSSFLESGGIHNALSLLTSHRAENYIKANR